MPSILGVVGSTDLNDVEKEEISLWVESFFNNHPEVTSILHLRSSGVEELVCDIAKERGISNESIPIEHYSWNAGQTEGTSPGTFKDANIKIIEQSDHILVITTHRDNSGGPLWTSKRARKSRRPVTQKVFATHVTPVVDTTWETEESNGKISENL
jgi:hypothetical protein